MKIQTNKTYVGIVHIGQREKSGLQIFEKLKQHRFRVKQWDILDEDQCIEELDSTDVIVVNIGHVDFDINDLLDLLFAKDQKIIINEAALSNELTGVKRQSWERHLLNKIDSNFSVLPVNSNDNRKLVNLKQFGIDEVWVLAASIGGPEALLQFFKKFKQSNKILFIIIQHIDKERIAQMAKQLDEATTMEVKVPLSGNQITGNRVYIYPTDEHLYFDEMGTVELVPLLEKSKFSPCIDQCCMRLSKNIKDLNMAVFSGMSSDGIKAAQLIKEKGNTVITQSEESCVLSTIIEGIKKTIDVDFSGTPESMAEFIINNS